MIAFIPRTLSGHLKEVRQYFPVLSLTGPRQAGKTTLLRHLFPDYAYVSFEDLNFRQQFTDDPISFLRQYDRKVIFHEAQRVSELFSYLQGRVDEDRFPARYILSGSQNFLLSKHVPQSLAGRVGISRLLPLDIAELSTVDLLPPTPAESILRGFYPELYQTDLPARFYYPNYVSSYLERDISGLIRESNMRDFRRFMSLCAASIGQTLEFSSFAKRLQVSVPTIKTWLHHLEESYILFTISPYFENFGKRLVKSPKLYFVDVGLASYLLQLTTAEMVERSSNYGPLFENLVIADRYKSRLHAGNQHPLYFYRDNHQLEVDLVEKVGDTLRLTDIKATATYHSRLTAGIQKVAALVRDEAPVLEVIYGGTERIEVGGVKFIPWNS